MNAPERALSPARTPDARSPFLRLPRRPARRAPPPPRPPAARPPFMRLAALLAGIEPGMPPINIAVGEPQHPVPPFVGPTLARHTAAFARYPGNPGTAA